MKQGTRQPHAMWVIVAILLGAGSPAQAQAPALSSAPTTPWSAEFALGWDNSITAHQLERDRSDQNQAVVVSEHVRADVMAQACISGSAAATFSARRWRVTAPSVSSRSTPI